METLKAHSEILMLDHKEGGKRNYVLIPNNFRFKVDNIRDIKLICYILYRKNSIDMAYISNGATGTLEGYDISIQNLRRYLGNRSTKEVIDQLDKLNIVYETYNKSLTICWYEDDISMNYYEGWNKCPFVKLMEFEEFRNGEYVLLQIDEIQKLSSMREFSIYYEYRKLINVKNKKRHTTIERLSEIGNIKNQNIYQNRYLFNKALKNIENKLNIITNLIIK